MMNRFVVLILVVWALLSGCTRGGEGSIVVVLHDEGAPISFNSGGDNKSFASRFVYDEGLMKGIASLDATEVIEITYDSNLGLIQLTVYVPCYIEIRSENGEVLEGNKLYPEGEYEFKRD